MKTSIINDSQKGRGFALLVLEFDGFEPEKPSPGETFELSIQGFPSQSYLQPEGAVERWPRGSSECFHQVLSSWDGTSLILELGPSILGCFKEKMHSFIVRGERARFSDIQLKTSSLLMPRKDQVVAPVQVTMTSTSAPKVDVQMGQFNNKGVEKESGPLGNLEEIQENSLQFPVPPPLPEQPVSPAVAVPIPPPFPVPPPVEDPVPPSFPVPPPLEQPSKSRLGLVIVLIVAVVLLVAAIGGVYWYLNHDIPEVPVVESQPQGTMEPLQEAKKLLLEEAPAVQLAEAVDRFEKIPGAEEAVFLLVRNLARQDPKYLMRYASFYDPLDHRPSGSVGKNAAYAYDEYERARKAGLSEAAGHQKDLLDWARSEEAVDDEGAQSLLSRDDL